MANHVERGLQAQRESRYIDFKREFDPASNAEWCEIIKDIVAMANSGGGAIMVGLQNGGEPSGADVQAVLDIDDADMMNKIRKYTGQDFPGVTIHAVEKDGHPVAAIEVAPAAVPMVFEHVGTYGVGNGKQKTAFAQGTVYFRHGSKSEPANNNDFRLAVEQQVARIRSQWLDGVRKVVESPQGSVVAVFQGDIRQTTDPDAPPIRLVDDPDAPAYRLVAQDTTYPFRQKELLENVNERLPDGVTINSYDVLAVRRTQDIDADVRYQYNPKYGSPQYSEAFADWVVDQYAQDPEFFVKARREFTQPAMAG